MADKPHALYRFYGQAGELLYVGITFDPGSRWRKHRDDKPWWAEVVGVTLEQHPTRSAVLEAERLAIVTEKPKYNVVHNRRAPTKVTGWPAEAMPDMCHDWCVREHRDWTTYFPRTWHNGRAEYVCRRGHRWSCWWGHRGSGTADLEPIVLVLS